MQRKQLATYVGNFFLDVMCCGAQLLMGLYRASGANAALGFVLVVMWSERLFREAKAADHAVLELNAARALQLASALGGLYTGGLAAIEGRTEATTGPGFFAALSFFLSMYLFLDGSVRHLKGNPDAEFARARLYWTSGHAAAHHLAIGLDAALRGIPDVGWPEWVGRLGAAGGVAALLIAAAATKNPELAPSTAAFASATLAGSGAALWLLRGGHAAFADVLLFAWVAWQTLWLSGRAVQGLALDAKRTASSFSVLKRMGARLPRLPRAPALPRTLFQQPAQTPAPRVARPYAYTRPNT